MKSLARPVFGVLLLAGSPSVWAAPKPFVETSLSPRTVTVGQPVTLIVDVFVPSYFTGAPQFPPLEVKDAVVVFLEEGGINLSQKVGEVDYAGQRRSYVVYPQRAGEFEVPSFAVSVRYAEEGRSSQRTPAPAKGGRFTATVPDAAKGLGYFIATPSFELDADTDRPLEELKVGDSFTRTITLSAADAFAIMLPPQTFPPVDGLAVYPGQPRLSDSSGERAAARVGKRMETATYLLRKEGTYRLPAIEVAWWDTNARTLRRAALPELEFSVASNPSLKTEIPLPEDPSANPPPPDPWKPVRDAARRYGPEALVALLVLALLYRLFGARLRALWARHAARRAECRESAAAYLDRLEVAARSGQPAEVLVATYRWLDRRETGTAAARLDRFAQESGSAELPKLADGLVAAVLAGDGSPSGQEFAKRFVQALRHANGHRARPDPPGALGPLNPREETP